MREHHGVPDQLLNIENYSGNIDGCITSHKVRDNVVEYFNDRGQMVTKHFGNKWMLAEIARYHFTEALRTQDEPYYFQEWSRNLHLAHYYEDFNPNWNTGLLQVPTGINRLPHRPRSEDDDEESLRQKKRQKTAENGNESIIIIEELSTPARKQPTAESDYELGNRSYNGEEREDNFNLGPDTDEDRDVAHDDLEEDDEDLDDEDDGLYTDENLDTDDDLDPYEDIDEDEGLDENLNDDDETLDYDDDSEECLAVVWSIKRLRHYLNSDVSDNNSIQIIEDLSTPAPRRYRIESDYDLGPDSDNENPAVNKHQIESDYDLGPDSDNESPAVNKFQIKSDYELGTDEEQPTDNKRDLADDEDDEVERLMDQTERLLDNIHRKLNNLLEADTDKDYDADSEDF